MSKKTNEMRELNEKEKMLALKIIDDKQKLRKIRKTLLEIETNTKKEVIDAIDTVTNKPLFSNDDKRKIETERLLRLNKGYTELLEVEEQLDISIQKQEVDLTHIRKDFRIEEVDLLEKKILIDY